MQFSFGNSTSCPPPTVTRACVHAYRVAQRGAPLQSRRVDPVFPIDSVVLHAAANVAAYRPYNAVSRRQRGLLCRLQRNETGQAFHINLNKTSFECTPRIWDSGNVLPTLPVGELSLLRVLLGCFANYWRKRRCRKLVDFWLKFRARSLRV